MSSNPRNASGSIFESWRHFCLILFDHYQQPTSSLLWSSSSPSPLSIIIIIHNRGVLYNHLGVRYLQIWNLESSESVCFELTHCRVVHIHLKIQNIISPLNSVRASPVWNNDDNENLYQVYRRIRGIFFECGCEQRKVDHRALEAVIFICKRRSRGTNNIPPPLPHIHSHLTHTLKQTTNGQTGR